MNYPLEVIAGPRNAEVVARDKESETTDRIEKELARTTTPISPPARDSAKRAKEQMMK